MKKRTVRILLVAGLLCLAGVIFGLSRLYPGTFARSAPIARTEGVCLTAAEFAGRYGADRDTANVQPQTRPVPVLEISALSVEDGRLTLQAAVTEGGVSRRLLAEGPLYRGYRQQDGGNSVVGTLTDQSVNYKVVHFNLFDSDADALFYADESWRQSPHLKLYLENAAGELLLFELDIPEVLAGLTAEGAEQAPPHADGFWFLPYVPYTLTERPGADRESPRRGSGWRMVPLPEQEITAVLDGTEYRYCTQPDLQFRGDKIASTGEWEFIFCEFGQGTATVAGRGYEMGPMVSYTDVTLLVMTGANTTLHSYRLSGGSQPPGHLLPAYTTQLTVELSDVPAEDRWGVTPSEPVYVMMGVSFDDYGTDVERAETALLLECTYTCRVGLLPDTFPSGTNWETEIPYEITVH